MPDVSLHRRSVHHTLHNLSAQLKNSATVKISPVESETFEQRFETPVMVENQMKNEKQKKPGNLFLQYCQKGTEADLTRQPADICYGSPS